MRDIAIDSKPGALPINTYMIYGDTRTGKTVFVATFPRPLIIADVTEGGYESIKTMDRSWWFEPDRAPIIKGIDTMNDLANLSPWVDEQIRLGNVRTIVFDAFSFYCDFFLAQLTRVNPTMDNRQLYGKLGVHLREIRTQYTLKGVNVVWLTLAKHPETEDPKGRPMIPGMNSDKFAAAVDFLFYATKTQTRENGKIVGESFELHTRQHGAYIAGNRLGVSADSLPDPFIGGYGDLLVALGIDPNAVRATLKAIKPVVAAKPAPATRPAPKVVSAPPPAGNNQASRGATNEGKV